MQYLIDTVVLSQYLRGRPGAVALVRPLVSQSVTSIVVYAEIVEYIRGLQQTDQWYQQLRRLMEQIPPLRLTYAIADRYADIRRILRPAGQLIGDIDLLIAATALVHNLTLVTADTDYQRVSGLTSLIVPRSSLK
ncbi:MAG: type II toxin-antitoxin system VapC family toxin [Ktedonobacterales bacterium]|nr:type II toxin-antitoxin system VapC family toxin [Ktedonobacterales bacterium]